MEYFYIFQRTNIRSVSRSIVNCRPPSPTSRGFTSTAKSPMGQDFSKAPPLGLDLASVLVEIENPEDIEKCPLANTFRDYLSKTDEEGLLDFAIVCNILRNKESDVKTLRNKTVDIKEVVYIPSKDAVLNKDRRDLIMMLGDTFFNEECIIPIDLNNHELIPKIRKAIENIGSLKNNDDEQSDHLSEVFGLVWQARCDFKVWKELETKYKRFLFCRYNSR